MKRYFIFSIIIALFCVGCSLESSCERDENFRMHLRLWPDHHNNFELRDQLTAALKHHKGLFDEAWLCMEIATIDPNAHLASAQNMALAADELRKVGVDASVQGISLGHGDSFEQQSTAFDPVEWGAARGVLGEQCRSTHCPRQKGFLEYIGTTYELYARECQPRSVWIDDDLRASHHPPARMICCCDECLAAFNRTYGHNFSQTELVAALDSVENGEFRVQWIEFSQQSLAMVAAAVARGVKRGSPSSKVGLQHAGFHRELLEGWDWNKIFDSIEVVTGQVPVSRPGDGFYNDHAPRGMIHKAYNIARQVRRLNPNIEEIACEIEGYQHWASGKSPYGLCVESMLYLAAGSTQLSYAIICSAAEPMEWYSANYFEALNRWRDTFEEYAAFNKDTALGGLDPYISKDIVKRPVTNYYWISHTAGDGAINWAALGVPYAPEAENAVGRVIDVDSAFGIPDDELKELLRRGGVVFDQAAWNVVVNRGLAGDFKSADDGVNGAMAKSFENASQGRCVVTKSFSQDISIAQRAELLRAIDCVTNNSLPVVVENMVQAVVMPRVDKENNLRSVLLLNCSISEQMTPTTMRLRGCRKGARLEWHQQGEKLKRLKYKVEGDDLIVEIPPLNGWHLGWLSVE